ncbi:peptide-methionine (S)-S-oxide reductase MsrA [Niveispirillum fermenti]|uniref:peptide-methionine (S)-S-oxide reductase MsrA n=1 Tax=Niveispirillum fermenti TaxID=1233113 RepID=UPI003A8BFF6F
MAIERAILAGGCFWGMQDLIRKVPGVVGTRVGYTGGDLENPTYKDVKTGHTGHAEAIEISFDNDKLSYRRLLEFFFQIHDPTTQDRQGNDTGSQYRSAIFVADATQAGTARAVKADVEESGRWPGKVVTEITDVGPFWEAEDFHQDYLERTPDGYTCHWVRPDWVLNGD